MSIADDAAAAVAAAQKVQADLETATSEVESVTLNYSDGTSTTIAVGTDTSEPVPNAEPETPAGMVTEPK